MISSATEIEFNALIMAGGTGGHIFPGLAIARELQARGWNTFWLGSVGGMEEQLIGKTTIPLNLISISGLRGNGFLGWVKAPFILLKAVFQAIKIIHKIKPDVVIGFGGFASGPGGLAAFLSGKPLIIHEQNAVAGMTNKILAKLSTRNFQAFPDALKNSKHYQTIGNPIRKEISELNKMQNSESPINLLIIGGSRGAKIFNEILPGILSPLVEQGKINIYHQSGQGNLSQTVAIYAENNLSEKENLRVDEFIEDMSKAYLWADLIVCRAGALTVSEIAAVGIAAIFVPFPYAVDDHQTKNALWLVEQEAAVLLPESGLQSELSKMQILSLINDPDKINRMAGKAKNIAYLNATRDLVDACELLMEEVA